MVKAAPQWVLEEARAWSAWRDVVGVGVLSRVGLPPYLEVLLGHLNVARNAKASKKRKSPRRKRRKQRRRPRSFPKKSSQPRAWTIWWWNARPVVSNFHGPSLLKDTIFHWGSDCPTASSRSILHILSHQNKYLRNFCKYSWKMQP